MGVMLCTGIAHCGGYFSCSELSTWVKGQGVGVSGVGQVRGIRGVHLTRADEESGLVL